MDSYKSNKGSDLKGQDDDIFEEGNPNNKPDVGSPKIKQGKYVENGNMNSKMSDTAE